MSKPKEINETIEFYIDVDAFNQQDYKKAHHIWEQNLKRLRNSENRFYLKHDMNSLILQIKDALTTESSTRRFNGFQIKTMRIP